MHYQASISLYAHRQPSPRIWQVGLDYASGWNQAHRVPFVSYYDRSLKIRFDDREEPECHELLADLDALERQHGLVWTVRHTRVYDEADFDAAPLVGLYGAGVSERPDAPIIANLDDAFGERRSCPSCGRPGALPGVQLSDLVFDESYLDGPAEQFVGDPPRASRGWDILTLSGGQLMVSPRVIAQLERLGVDGWDTRPMLTSRFGRRSERALQLRPTRALPEPRSEDTTILGGRMCPTCGFFEGELEGEVQLRRSDLGDGELFASWGDPLPIYVSQRVYATLRGAGITGLSPEYVIRLTPGGD